MKEFRAVYKPTKKHKPEQVFILEILPDSKVAFIHTDGLLDVAPILHFTEYPRRVWNRMDASGRVTE